MSLRERLRWFGQMALVVFILGSAAFLSAITAMRLAIQGREVEVPRVVGLKAAEAQATLSGLGLGLKIADRAYSDLPLDHVVQQSPPPGMRVKVGQRAHVVLSVGPRKLPVPLLEGKSVRAARLELLRAGLAVGEVSNCYLPEAEPDVVVKQSPPPGGADAGSPRVNLLVSLGQRKSFYVMPDLAGLSLLEAQQRLSAAGLRLSKITFAPSPEARRGSVVQHVPSRGARISAGVTVELQVAE